MRRSSLYSKHKNLFQDVAQGKIGALESFLNDGGGINYSNTNRDTILHIAIKFNRPDIVTFAINKNANINAYNKLGEAPLFCAIQSADLAIVKELIYKGARLSVKDKQGNNLFHLAAQRNSQEIFEILLNKNIKLCEVNKLGETPLHIAVNHNSTQITELLLNNLTKKQIDYQNKAGFSALHMAVQNNNIELVDLLISRGTSVDSKDKCGESPIALALNNHNAEIAKLLISHVKDISESKNDILKLAIKSHNDDVIKCLIEEHGVDLNHMDQKSGFSPLHLAIRSGSESTIKLLVEHGAKVDAMVVKQLINNYQYAVNEAINSSSYDDAALLKKAAIISNLTLDACDFTQVNKQSAPKSGLKKYIGFIAPKDHLTEGAVEMRSEMVKKYGQILALHKQIINGADLPISASFSQVLESEQSIDEHVGNDSYKLCINVSHGVLNNTNTISVEVAGNVDGTPVELKLFNKAFTTVQG